MRVGRDEIDIVAIEPGAPATLVFVEVRSGTTSRFGAPEERVDRAKVRALYRAAARVRSEGSLPLDRAVSRAAPWRIDLLAVDLMPSIGLGSGDPVVRHLRALDLR